MDQKTPSQNKLPRLVAVSGSIAAGKDEFAKYLVDRQGAASIEVGTFARHLAEEINSEESRLYDRWVKNLGEYDSAYILQRLVDEIIEGEGQTTEMLVISGVRTPAEAAFLKAHFGSDLLLVFVKVGDIKLRYERLRKRSFASDPDDFQLFVELDTQMKADNALEETARWADIILWNDGSLESYHRKIETEVLPYLTGETT